MSFPDASIKDYIDLSTYGIVPREFVPINGARSVVPHSGNIIDDLCYFFKFHETLKPIVISSSEAKIMFNKGKSELVITISGKGVKGCVSLTASPSIMSGINYHMCGRGLYCDHDLNPLVDILYSLNNIFYSYANIQN